MEIVFVFASAFLIKSIKFAAWRVAIHVTIEYPCFGIENILFRRVNMKKNGNFSVFLCLLQKINSSRACDDDLRLRRSALHGKNVL